MAEHHVASMVTEHAVSQPKGIYLGCLVPVNCDTPCTSTDDCEGNGRCFLNTCCGNAICLPDACVKSNEMV